MITLHSNTNVIQLCAIEAGEALQVRQMAQSIWPRVYADIISAEQITYMLDWMYTVDKIQDEITTQSMQYFWIVTDEPIGFLSVDAFKPDHSSHMHKCYLEPTLQGQGYGSQALTVLSNLARDSQVSGLELRVNRYNTAAVGFYKKNGFHVIKEDCADIGQGFVMDDFIMHKPLNV